MSESQTRSVLSAATNSPRPLAELRAEWQASRPDSSGNGSLMRTGPLALGGSSGLSRASLADFARTVSALTHASADPAEACVLWTDAIRRAIDAPVVTDGGPDWIGHMAVGLELQAGGIRIDEALDRVALLTGTRPQPFLIDALRLLED
jgi:ADP-ribosylglycohydrolase